MKKINKAWVKGWAKEKRPNKTVKVLDKLFIQLKMKL